jgi:hypothetical protein
VSSGASRHGGGNVYVDYAASKGAVDVLTLGLSKEVGPEGIRVNCVRPGIIYTEIHASGGDPDRVNKLASTVPLGRGGQPEEIAETILWLLSEQSSYVSGAIIDAAARADLPFLLEGASRSSRIPARPGCAHNGCIQTTKGSHHEIPDRSACLPPALPTLTRWSTPRTYAASGTPATRRWRSRRWRRTSSTAPCRRAARASTARCKPRPSAPPCRT